MSNAELENLVAHVLKAQDAAGVLMLVITKEKRAEVIAAIGDQLKAGELPEMIHNLADEVAAGGGVPCGRHLQTLKA